MPGLTLEPTGVAGPNMVLIVPVYFGRTGVAGPNKVLIVPLYLKRTGDFEYLALPKGFYAAKILFLLYYSYNILVSSDVPLNNEVT